MVRLRFETDLGTSLKAAADLGVAYERVGKQVSGSAKEMRALELAAKRLVDSNLSPQEKYNQRLETMAKAVKAGKLSMEDATKTADAMRRKLDDSGRAIDGLSAKFAGLAGGAAIIGALSRGFQEMSENAQKAADNVFNNLASFGELQQVSPTKESFQQNLARSRALIREGVVRPDQTALANDIVFGMVSAGYTESEKDLIAKMGADKFVKPEGLLGMAEGLGKYRRLFGEQDAGSLQDVANKIVQASGTAQASVPETLKALLEVGSSAKQLGLTDESTSAAFLAVEAQSPNADVAATKLRSYLDQVNKKGLWKGNFDATNAEIQRQIAGGANIFDVLGEQRAVGAYTDISSQSDFVKQQEALMMSAPKRNLLGTQSNFLNSDPRLGAANARTEQEGLYQSMLDEGTTETNLALSIWTARKKSARERGGWPAELGETLMQSTVGWGVPNSMLIEGERRGGFRNVGTESLAARQIDGYAPQSDFARGGASGGWGMGGPQLGELVMEAQAQTAVLQEISNRMRPVEAPGPGGRQE